MLCQFIYLVGAAFYYAVVTVTFAFMVPNIGLDNGADSAADREETSPPVRSRSRRVFGWLVICAAGLVSSIWLGLHSILLVLQMSMTYSVLASRCVWHPARWLIAVAMPLLLVLYSTIILQPETDDLVSFLMQVIGLWGWLMLSMIMLARVGTPAKVIEGSARVRSLLPGIALGVASLLLTLCLCDIYVSTSSRTPEAITYIIGLVGMPILCTQLLRAVATRAARGAIWTVALIAPLIPYAVVGLQTLILASFFRDNIGQVLRDREPKLRITSTTVVVVRPAEVKLFAEGVVQESGNDVYEYAFLKARLWTQDAPRQTEIQSVWRSDEKARVYPP